MVTIVPVSVEGAVPRAIQGSSQDVFSKGAVYGHNLHRHHHGPRGRRSSPSRFGRRLHHHHHLDHLKGPHSLAHPHGHGDLSHGARRRHGGPDHGLRGHVSRGLHDVAVREHGPHFRRRMHRSLSPQHLMHNRFSDGSPGSPHRGNRGHRRHCGRVPCAGNFQGMSFRGHHLHNLHTQDPNSGSECDRSSPLPAAIEQGIEHLGQLSLRSESGAL